MSKSTTISIIILFILHVSSFVYGQTPSDVKTLCQESESAASLDNFSLSKAKYDAAIARIKELNDPTLDLYVKTELVDYIVCNIARADTTTAKQYALQALELRNNCFAAVAQQGYFSNMEEYICNVAVEYRKFGHMLADAGLLTDALQCITVAPAFFQKAEINCDEYSDALEDVGYIYSAYLKKYAQEILFQYEALKACAQKHGFDSARFNEIFDRMLTSYVSSIAYLSFVGESGLINQYAGRIAIPSYEDTKQIIEVWNDVRGDIVNTYGQAAFDSLISKHKKTINGIPSIVMGIPETDCLYLAILYILNDHVSEFEKSSSALLSMIDDPDLQMAYSEDLVTAIKNAHYINSAYSFYSKLKQSQLDKGRKDNAEVIDVACGSLLYSYGNYYMAWPFCFDVVDQISGGKSPEYFDLNTYLKKVLLASHLWSRDKHNDYTSREYLEYAQKLADSQEDSVDPRIRSTIYGNIGSSMADAGAYTKAEEYILKSIEIYNDYALRIDGAQVDNPKNLMWPVAKYANLSDVYISMKRYDDAKQILEKCLTYYNTNYPESPALSYIYYQYTCMADVRGKVDDLSIYARRMYDSSLNSYLGNSLGMTKVQRTDYWYNNGGTLSYMLEVATDFALRMDDLSGLCYDAALVQKGFLLGQDAIIKNNVENSTDIELKEVYGQFKQAERSGDSKKSRLENRTMYLYSKHPEFKNSYTRYTWEDVQASLGKRDVAIEFAMSNTKTHRIYTALVLKSGMKEPEVVRLCDESELKDLFEKKAIAYKANDRFYDDVWKGVAEYLSPGDNVYFSPYGLLSQMNIEVLAGPDGKAMNKKYNMFRVSTTGCLCSKENRSDISSAVLFGGLNYNTDTTSMAISNRTYANYSSSDKPDFTSAESITRKGWSYLPGTKEEVDKIGTILKSKRIKSEVYTNDEGSEPRFKALSGGTCPLLHIATHGFYLNQTEAERKGISFMKQPEGDSHIYPLRRAGLVFSGGQHAWLGEEIPEGIDDGILTAEEISGMDLSATSLLVLSACQTGLGDVSGEGVYGLQRGFKIAGVGTIIMSLWEVNDTATELMMNKFYTALTSGRSKRDSFNAAVEAVKAKYPDPEYWAAFIMLD